MAYKMHPVSRKIRIGIDKNNHIHIEEWPIENGWYRDIDPVLSSNVPKEIEIKSETLSAIRDFILNTDNRYKKAIHALQKINDLKIEMEVPEDDFEEGRESGVIDCADIAMETGLI